MHLPSQGIFKAKKFARLSGKQLGVVVYSCHSSDVRKYEEEALQSRTARQKSKTLYSK
jgi:hypothetical protein